MIEETMMAPRLGSKYDVELRYTASCIFGTKQSTRWPKIFRFSPHRIEMRLTWTVKSVRAGMRSMKLTIITKWIVPICS